MAPNAQAELPHLQIVDKLVSEFPLVNTALDYANSRYVALKDSSALVSSTLDRAEKSIQLVVTNGVVPVLHKLEQPIHYADNMAVHGLDIAVAKYESVQKSSGELKDSTRKVVDQTTERLQAAKSTALQTVQSKVQSVMNLPKIVMPLLDQVLSDGEKILDYLMPDARKDGSKPVTTGTSSKHEDGQTAQDTTTVVRLALVRIRQFSDKVQQRIMDYSRDRWIPAFFASVTVIQKNVASLVASSVAAKLLAHGHSSPVPAVESSSNATNAQESPKAQTQNVSTPEKSASSPNSTSNSSSPASNDDVSHKHEDHAEDAEEYDSVTSH